MTGYGVRAVSYALGAVLLAATSSISITVAHVQQSTAQSRFNFNIPAKLVTQAVNDIGRVTGLSVVFRENRAITAKGNPVRGSLTAQQALSTLLAGTGLSYRFSNATTVQIFDQSASSDNGAAVASDGSVILETITIQSANQNSTMALPDAYAGGQVARGGQIGMLGNRDVMNTPFSQTNYTKKTIQNQQARTVQDVMNNDPSVVATSSGTTFSWENDSIRGFRTWSYFASRSLNGLPGMSPLFSPSMDFVERVEIFKGPSALTNGMAVASGNIGGTVNLVTKQADDEPITQLTTRFTSRSQLGAHVDVGRRFGTNNEFGMRFNGSFDKGDTPISPEQAQNGSAALNLDYRGERFRLSADIAHMSREAGAGTNYLLTTGAGFVPKAPSAGKSLAPEWSSSTPEATIGMIRGEFDITDDIMVYGGIGAQKFDQKLRGGGVVYLLDSSGNYRVTPWNDHKATDVLSMQAGVRAKVTTGPVNHDLNLNVSGGRFQRFSNPFTPGAFIFPGTIYNPVFGSEPTQPAFGPLNRASDTKTSSLGIADTLSIFDDRVQFTAGVRYQNIDSTSYNFNTNLVTSEYESTAWTPAFGLVVKPWQDVSLYASYIEGLETGTTVGDAYANAGEVFAPYVSKQYEAGVKVDWGAVTTTLAAFQIARPNAIALASTTGGLSTLSLDGEHVNRGIELNAYGEVVNGVRLLGGITFLDARQTKTANGTYDGERAAGAPKFRAVVGGEWDTPFVDGLTLTGRLTYTSNQVVNNSMPSLTIPAWTQVDIGARYTFSSPWNEKPVTVRLNIDNLFDKSYWKTAESGYLYEGEPRTFRVSTTFNF